MNEIREFHQGLRRVGDLTIVFHAKDTIYLLDSNHQTVIQRWWKVRGSWVEWCKMCRKFKRRKNLTYGKALAIAVEHGFGAESASRVPNIDDYKIIDWSKKDETDD